MTYTEEETELQRTRRRYQQRRCLKCGSPDRWYISNFCRDCYAHVSYCFNCERVLPRDQFWHQGECKECQSRRQNPNWHTETARQRRLAGGIKGAATNAQRAREQAQQIDAWERRGWSYGEIARALSAITGKEFTANAVYLKLKRYRSRGTSQ